MIFSVKRPQISCYSSPPTHVFIFVLRDISLSIFRMCTFSSNCIPYTCLQVYMVFKSNFSPNRQFVSCFLKLEATAYYACCTPRVSRSFLSSEHFVLTTTVLDLYSTSSVLSGKYCDLIFRRQSY